MSARLALASLALLLGACSLAPTYQVPDSAPAPQTYKETDGWKVAAPSDSAPRGSWWEQFHDDTLNQMEAKVGATNQDLKAALARLDQARAVASASRSAYFPTIIANAGSLNARTSTNRPFYFAAFDPKYLDNLVGLGASYELDVWGRIRNAVAASDALAVASAADLATLELSTRAELANDYFALRGYDAEQGVLDRAVESYRSLSDLTQQLFEGGGASAADVALAKVQWQNAVTQATENRLKRSQMEHAIAVLVGESASTFSLPEWREFTTMPPPVAPGLPSSLLERRPDIASAERRVAAANAEIGVARAAFFPVFGLNALGGFESGAVSNWATAPSRYWSFGPSAALTVFDAGRRQAVTDQAHAAFDEAAANYRQAVLLAYQEVEDNLAALHRLEQEFQSVAAADEAAREALNQANLRYQGGIASYLEVMTAQNLALQSDFAMTDLRARRLMASVQLVKALGGSWQQGNGGGVSGGGHESR